MGSKMKTTIAFVSFLVLVGSIGTDSTTPLSAGVSADEDVVRSLDDQARQAVLKGDYAALEQLWSEDFTVNAPNNEIVIGKRNVLATVRRVARYSSFERSIEYLRIDGDVAIVMGAETVQPVGDVPLAGKTVARRFTNIWQRHGATWRSIARHASVVSVR